MKATILPRKFFDREPLLVAKELLGKVICVKYEAIFLKVIITQTEAYYLEDRASHAFLGYTQKRQALFMSPGTIYMYYSRGGDSLNISCQGAGNAVLIKSGIPLVSGRNGAKMLEVMHYLNPHQNPAIKRPWHKLCSGQALLCRSLNLKRAVWDQKQFDRKLFYLAAYDQSIVIDPKDILQTTRLGIPKGRDEHLPYRFILKSYQYKTKRRINYTLS